MKLLNSIRFISLYFVLGLVMFSCQEEDQKGTDIPEPSDCNSLADIDYNPNPYTIQKPDHYQEIPIPEDNPMTQEGVYLGRKLFYDPILSADSTQACASCHLPEFAFTDGNAVSTGIDGIAGERSAMSLVDVAYVRSGLFWDGRVASLEDQALVPIEDPIELHHEWPKVIEDFQSHSEYPELFRKAFGIECKKEITKEMAAKALAQFERTIISSGNSKFDRFMNGENTFLADEINGWQMFFNHEVQSGLFLPDAECSHCHASPLFMSQDFINNALQEPDANLDYPDQGRYLVSGIPADRGKFRVPTLRNIALTAPYMHDGSLATLEDVMDHYASGGHLSSNTDPLLRDINLSEKQKEQIIAFLHTLTDTTLINRPDLQPIE